LASFAPLAVVGVLALWAVPGGGVGAGLLPGYGLAPGVGVVVAPAFPGILEVALLPFAAVVAGAPVLFPGVVSPGVLFAVSGVGLVGAGGAGLAPVVGLAVAVPGAGFAGAGPFPGSAGAPGLMPACPGGAYPGGYYAGA